MQLLKKKKEKGKASPLFCSRKHIFDFSSNKFEMNAEQRLRDGKLNSLPIRVYK